jgi:hypothetical protein
MTLPPSLDGKVPFFEGGGPFWPAGRTRSGGAVLESFPPQGDAVPVIVVRAVRLNRLQRLLGVDRRVALGAIAATSTKPARTVPLSKACGHFVDWYEPLP